MLFLILIFFFNSLFAFDDFDSPEIDKKDKAQIINDVFAGTSIDPEAVTIVALKGSEKLFVLLKVIGDGYLDKEAELFLISKDTKYEILNSNKFKYTELCFPVEPEDNHMDSINVNYGLVLDTKIYEINRSSRAFAVYCKTSYSDNRGTSRSYETYFNAIKFDNKNLDLVLNLLLNSAEDFGSESTKKTSGRTLSIDISENKWTFAGKGEPPLVLQIAIVYNWKDGKFVKASQSFDDSAEHLCKVKNFKKLRANLNIVAKSSSPSESYEKFWTLFGLCSNKTEFSEFGWGLNDMVFYANKAGKTKICKQVLETFIKDKRFKALPESLQKSSKTNYKSCNNTEILNRIAQNKNYLGRGFGGYCKRNNFELSKTLMCNEPVGKIESAAHFLPGYQWPELLPFDIKLCKNIAELTEECKKALVVPIEKDDYLNLIPGFNLEKLKNKKREYVHPDTQVLKKMIYSRVPDTDKLHDSLYRYSSYQKDLIDEIDNTFFDQGIEMVAYREGKYLYVLSSPHPWRESTCYVDETANCHALFWIDLEENNSLLLIEANTFGGGDMVGYASENFKLWPDGFKESLMKNFQRLRQTEEKVRKIRVIRGQSIESTDFIIENFTEKKTE